MFYLPPTLHLLNGYRCIMCIILNPLLVWVFCVLFNTVNCRWVETFVLSCNNPRLTINLNLWNELKRVQTAVQQRGVLYIHSFRQTLPSEVSLFYKREEFIRLYAGHVPSSYENSIVAYTVASTMRINRVPRKFRKHRNGERLHVVLSVLSRLFETPESGWVNSILHKHQLTYHSSSIIVVIIIKLL